MSEKQSEPLPIWFFVGLILVVYGVLLVGSGFLTSERQTVLAELRPGIWWGALTALCGGVFLFIGLRGRREQPPAKIPPSSEAQS